MTTADKIKVMQAYERGENIEFTPDKMLAPKHKCWMLSKPKWNWQRYDYRIKPVEPKTIWVNEYKDKTAPHAHNSKKLALANIYDDATRTAVPYREVIEK
jgi:hypothetical protein